jgi:pyruvate kinase
MSTPSESNLERARSNDDRIRSLMVSMEELRAELLRIEERFEKLLADVHPNYRRSARNLAHYIGLRRKDRRALQDDLTRMGFSSLGRAEPDVMANVDAILSLLGHVSGAAAHEAKSGGNCLDFDTSHALLNQRTEALLGAAPERRHVRIMVTMPPDAATDTDLVHRLLAAGMDCMRINCAHDDESAWRAMILNLRRAQRTLQRPCKILMDLAGPKIRTWPFERGPQVLKWRPRRDDLGRVIAPARIWVSWKPAGHQAPEEADAVLPVVGMDAVTGTLHDGDRIRFRDARQRKRVLTVAAEGDGGCWAEGERTAYIVPNLKLSFESRCPGSNVTGTARIGPLPARNKAIVLRMGDSLLLVGGCGPGATGPQISGDHIAPTAVIGCTAPDILRDLRPGERILLDDGRIAGMIRTVHENAIEVNIMRALPEGSKLRGDRGINLPDSTLRLPSLTPKDLKDLAFVARHADMVNLSWVRHAADIEALQSELIRLDGTHLGIVLKIETQQGFDRFPDLLLAAMKSPNVGVMLARGDLAAEVGYERLAEVQEELLWMCEAAHVPLIWATQVLESLAKDGLPSRAEITDAAMGVRAECVMLNKGRYAEEAIRALDDILRRMQRHQSKKRSMLRKLNLAFRMFSSS